MKIKINKVPKDIGAIPTARVAVAPGVLDNGQGQITVTISAENSHGIPSVVGSLRLSLNEAGEIRNDIDRKIEEARALMAGLRRCRCGQVIPPDRETCGRLDC
jgi:hypothetical protein